MGLLLGLSPFVAFFVLMRLHSPMAGLIAGLVTAALLGIRMWRRGESIKILEVGTFALFFTLVLYTLVAAPAWTVAGVRLAIDCGLLAIVLFSLAIGRPFSIQYAREQVPEAYWHAPLFLATNRLISLAWAGAFAVLVAADAAGLYAPGVPLWIDVAASVIALLAAVGFTVWYPRRVRRRVAIAQAEGSAETATAPAATEVTEARAAS